MGAVRRIRRSVRRVQTLDTGSSVDQSPRGSADAGTGSPADTHEASINVSDPTNVVVTSNAGMPGSVRASSTRQSVRVKQDGTQTYEESEATESRT